MGYHTQDEWEQNPSSGPPTFASSFTLWRYGCQTDRKFWRQGLSPPPGLGSVAPSPHRVPNRESSPLPSGWSSTKPSAARASHRLGTPGRNSRAPQQPVPHHLQEGHVHRGTPGGLGLRLLPPSLACVCPLDPRRGLHRGQGVRGQSLGLLAGFSVLPSEAIERGLDQGSFTGSWCLPRRWSAAMAARRLRAVASDLPSVSTKCSR